MLTKNKIGFLLAACIPLPAYAVFFWIKYIRELGPINLNQFTIAFRQYALLGAFLVFALILWGHKRENEDPHQAPALALSRAWGFAVLFMLSISLGGAIYVNPHARFSSYLFSFVTPSARLIKFDYYRKLSYDPNLVILGSSRAFTISPAYIQQKLGYQAFNMAVEGARLEDHQILLNFLVDHQAKSRPKVILLELSSSNLRQNLPASVSLLPIKFIPYMSSSMKLRTMESVIEDAWGMQSMSDSVYLVYNELFSKTAGNWLFEADGEQVISKPPSEEAYRLTFTPEILNIRMSELPCASVDKIAAKSLEEFVATAENSHIGVIIYNTPLVKPLYDKAVLRDPKGMAQCEKVLDDYMSSLMALHPNVFYKDLAYYPPISDLEEKGYYDIIHLNPQASELLIDALAPDINAAFQWAGTR